MVFIVRLNMIVREYVWGLVQWRSLTATIPHVLMTYLWVSLGLSGFFHLCNQWLLSDCLIRHWWIIFFPFNCLGIRWCGLHFGLFRLLHLLRCSCHLLFDPLNFQKWCFVVALLNGNLQLLALSSFHFTVQVANYVIEVERFLADPQSVRGCFVHF